LEVPVRDRCSIFRSADSTVASSIALSTSHSLSKEAVALRVKAAWFRQLAETSYDERVISELYRYAVELEARAEILELWETSGE
jgi:hypothetical protein